MIQLGGMLLRNQVARPTTTENETLSQGTNYSITNISGAVVSPTGQAWVHMGKKLTGGHRELGRCHDCVIGECKYKYYTSITIKQI